MELELDFIKAQLSFHNKVKKYMQYEFISMFLFIIAAFFNIFSMSLFGLVFYLLALLIAFLISAVSTLLISFYLSEINRLNWVISFIALIILPLAFKLILIKDSTMSFLFELYLFAMFTGYCLILNSNVTLWIKDLSKRERELIKDEQQKIQDFIMRAQYGEQ